MNPSILPALLTFYGLFLVCCGLSAVLFIGAKAKTALISGGISGALSWVLAYFVNNNSIWATEAGRGLSMVLFFVFAWRSTKTLFRIFELLKSDANQDEINSKGIAFLIISLMAVVSLFVFVFQILIDQG